MLGRKGLKGTQGVEIVGRAIFLEYFSIEIRQTKIQYNTVFI